MKKKKNNQTKINNVVSLIPSELNFCINKFEKSKSLVEFLEILTVVAQTSVNCDFIYKYWDIYVDQLVCKNPQNVVLDWIGCLHFLSNEVHISEKSALSDENYSDFDQEYHDINISSIAKDIALAYAEEGGEFYKIGDWTNDTDYPYGIFMAAWPLSDILTEHPDINEAAKLISSYMDALYIAEKPDDDIVLVKQYGLIDFLKNRLLPWVFNDEFDKQIVYKLILEIMNHEIKPLEPDTYPLGFSFLEIAKLIPVLPPKLFCTFVEVFTNGININLPSSKLSEIEKISIKTLLDAMLGYAGITVNSFNSITCIYIWSYFIIDKEILNLAISRLTNIRRSDPYGYSPITWDMGWCIRENISRICEVANIALDHHEIAYLIAPTNPNEYGFLGGFSCDKVWIGEEFLDTNYPYVGIMRTKIYCTVIDCALNEGWYEFANACLAFFIFSQPIYCNNKLFINDWAVFSKRLLKGSSLPSFERVRVAVRFAIDRIVSEEKYNKIDVLNLEYWAKDSTDNKNLPFISPIPIYNKIQHDLIEYFGENLWNKINIITKRQLQDAEKQWSAMHGHLGRGVHDFGSLAISFIKPIEVELRTRLQPILQSVEYINFRQVQGRNIEKNPTFGTLLHLLNDFHKLPKALQEKIKELGIRIHTDKDLLTNLFDLLKLRNEAAHSAGFTASDIVKLRGLLYDKQILKRFFNLM
ncbi:MAG: hypothetical protein ABSB19_20555 [Methylomonas sp.]|jgi:hypothetical protein